MKLKLVLVTTLLQVVLAIPFSKKPGVDRDSLPDLLGLDPSGSSETSQTTSTANSELQSTIVGGDIGLSGLSGLFSTIETSTRTKISASHVTASRTSISDVQPTSSTTNAPAPTPVATSTSTMTTPSAGSSSGDSKAWKVVGVAVISVIAVVVVIVCVIFWDRGTRFMREVLCGKKRSDGIEDFVPDWEKRSWEVKLAEDNHRYPAVPSDSFDSLVRAPSALSHADDEDDKRHPFPLRPNPVPVFVDFVSPDAQGTRPMENHSYSPMTPTELQRQNSRAAQSAYTACT